MENNVSVEIIIEGRDQYTIAIWNVDTLETFVEDVGPIPFTELVSEKITLNNLRLITLTFPGKSKTRPL